MFIEDPKNQTTRYGEIAEFRCRVPSFQNYSMQIFIGNTKYYGFAGDQIINQDIMKEYRIDHREMNASYEQTHCHNSSLNISCAEGIGIFWMVVNNKTLQLVNSVWCKARADGHGESAESGVAFVDVIYPECNKGKVQSTDPKISVRFPNTSHFVHTLMPDMQPATMATTTVVTTPSERNSGTIVPHYNGGLAQVYISSTVILYSVYCILFVID